MKRDPAELISRSLDGLLTDEEQVDLSGWLMANPENARQYALAVMLHDRMRDELASQSAVSDHLAGPDRLEVERQPVPMGEMETRRRWSRWFMVTLGIFLASLLMWKGMNGTPLSAAVEFNRLIAANSSVIDRTFRITVEASETPDHRRPPEPDPRRPPKPPLDGAILHVRSGGQFVLIRQAEEARRFVTGSDGVTSWAVRPDGPVRFSRDVNRFNRDVPGHEYQMPLDNLQSCLRSLQDAYEITFADEPTSAGLRQLNAVRGRKLPGPSRVEIAYEPSSRLIHELRFVGMPYGPERLTLRMTLETGSDLGADYFTHSAHHSPDREVIEE